MKKQGKNIVYGKAVRPNAGIRAWYRAVLRALVDDMAEKTKKRLLRVYYTKNPLTCLPKGLIVLNGSPSRTRVIKRFLYCEGLKNRLFPYTENLFVFLHCSPLLVQIVIFFTTIFTTVDFRKFGNGPCQSNRT